MMEPRAKMFIFFCLLDWNLAPLLHLRHLTQDSDLVRVLRKEGDPS